jgi:hypothetical protein
MLDGALKITLEGEAMEPTKGLIVMPLFHIGARAQSPAFLSLGGVLRALSGPIDDDKCRKAGKPQPYPDRSVSLT